MTPYEFNLRYFHFTYMQQLDWQRAKTIACAMGVDPKNLKLEIEDWFSDISKEGETTKPEFAPEELEEFDDISNRILNGEIKTRIMTDDDIQSWSNK